MEFPGEIVANIIDQRLALFGDDQENRQLTVYQANHLLVYGIPVAVEFNLIHSSCDPTECEKALPFEVWILRRHKENIGTSPLLPLFLKQAIRSQLHFSPINSWLAQKGEKLSIGTNVSCSYRISTRGLLPNIANAVVETHNFPICKYETADPTLGEYLSVEVKWIRTKSMPDIGCVCTVPMIEKKNERETTWLAPPTDGIPPSSTEDEETGSSTPSSPSFPPSPPSEPVTPDVKLTAQRDLDLLADFVVEPGTKKVKRTRKKASLFVAEDSDNESAKIVSDEREKSPRSRIRKTRRCKAMSTSENEPVNSLRSRNSRSFCAGSLPGAGAAVVFNPRTKLPMNSSPSPLKRTPLVQNLASKLREKFTALDGDSSSSDSEYVAHKNSTIYGSQHSNNSLLCNFEESALNGRLEPVSNVEGFKLQLAVTGSFSVPHTVLPVSTYFFNVSDDNAPSLYLGHCSLKEAFGRKAVHIPKKCVVQATLLNPQGSVVRIFIIKVDCSDIPPKSRTFIRQRTFAAPEGSSVDSQDVNSHSWLRYLINLRLATDRAGKLYMHTDLRMLFSNKTDLDVMNLAAERGPLCSENEGESKEVKAGATYEFLTATEIPKYSPIK